jgi:hypothetical protein
MLTRQRFLLARTLGVLTVVVSPGADAMGCRPDASHGYSATGRRQLRFVGGPEHEPRCRSWGWVSSSAFES